MASSLSVSAPPLVARSVTPLTSAAHTCWDWPSLPLWNLHRQRGWLTRNGCACRLFCVQGRGTAGLAPVSDDGNPRRLYDVFRVFARCGPAVRAGPALACPNLFGRFGRIVDISPVHRTADRP